MEAVTSPREVPSNTKPELGPFPPSRQDRSCTRHLVAVSFEEDGKKANLLACKSRGVRGRWRICRVSGVGLRDDRQAHVAAVTCHSLRLSRGLPSFHPTAHRPTVVLTNGTWHVPRPHFFVMLLAVYRTLQREPGASNCKTSCFPQTTCSQTYKRNKRCLGTVQQMEIVLQSGLSLPPFPIIPSSPLSQNPTPRTTFPPTEHPSGSSTHPRRCVAWPVKT